jgi:hypothetical protein
MAAYNAESTLAPDAAPARAAFEFGDELAQAS